jgi:hypothetical protein
MILRRNPHDRFSQIVPEWKGETAVLLGGGPSLTLQQVQRVRRVHEDGKVRCIAVNDSYLWCEWSDLLYAADSHWWRDHAAGVPKPMLGLTADDVRKRFAAFPGERCSIQNSGANVTDESVHLIRNLTYPYNSSVLSTDPGYLATGRNSAYQSVNLLMLAGVKTIILLGIDGRPGKDGRTHWSGGHPRPTPVNAYEEYRRAWSAAETPIKAAGVKVVNCSPGTYIDTFPKVALEDALAEAVV